MKRVLERFIWQVLVFYLACSTSSVFAQDRPNILVIWGDDVGITNISAYRRGLMGYQTPNPAGCQAGD